MKINVKDFGAVGDGTTLNTAAFARAIETAKTTTDGHAVIIVPPGTYLTGSITLESNMTLRIEAGARILGSRNIADYTDIADLAHYRELYGDKRTHSSLQYYLVGAQHAENVYIEGDGIIDASGDAFWEDVCFDGKPWLPNDPNLPISYRVLKPRRPRTVAVSLWKCTNLALRGVSIVNSASYTVWTQACTNVRITDITIDNPFKGPNTDGIDIDCSSNVFISGCHISAGDDCIALKSDTSRFAEPGRPCENVVVTNCILTTKTCGVRIGYEGDGPIRDCTFSNLVIHDTRHAIDMLSPTPIGRTDFVEGTPIERIIFSNITARNVGMLFCIWAGAEQAERPYKAQIRNLTFSNIDGLARSGSFIGSKNGSPIENLTMRDVRMEVQEHPCLQDAIPCEYPSIWGGGYIPSALWLYRVKNAQLNNVSLTTDSPRGYQLRWDQAVNLQKNGVTFPENGKL